MSGKARGVTSSAPCEGRSDLRDLDARPSVEYGPWVHPSGGSGRIPALCGVGVLLDLEPESVITAKRNRPDIVKLDPLTAGSECYR